MSRWGISVGALVVLAPGCHRVRFVNIFIYDNSALVNSAENRLVFRCNSVQSLRNHTDMFQCVHCGSYWLGSAGRASTVVRKFPLTYQDLYYGTKPRMTPWWCAFKTTTIRVRLSLPNEHKQLFVHSGVTWRFFISFHPYFVSMTI